MRERAGGGLWGGQPARGREGSSAGAVPPRGAGPSEAGVERGRAGAVGCRSLTAGRPVPDVSRSCSVFRGSGVRVFRGSVSGCSGDAAVLVAAVTSGAAGAGGGAG